MSRSTLTLSHWGRQLRRLLTWGAGVWLVLIVLLLVTEHLTTRFRLTWSVRVYFGLTLLCSLLAAVAYAWDKWKASRAGWRIPEVWLHLFALLGGWPGAVLAQQTFRHKTQKVSFRLVLSAIILLHLGLILWYAISRLNAA